MKILPILLLLATFAPQERKPPPAVAIVGAKIYTGAAVMDIGTIVMRNGKITAMGSDIVAPVDADVIEGKNLHVYPGFIDASTANGLGDTKRTPEERKKAEATPNDNTSQALGSMESANRKGIRPEFSAADRFTITDEQLEKIHRSGFVAMNIAAREEYFGGTGALVMVNGGTRRETVLKAVTGMAGSFASYGDGYPTTAMGVLAHLRQVLLDAQRLRGLVARFEKEPLTTTRPAEDPALEALWPLLDRKLPLFMEANTTNEIERALGLAEDFKLNLVITGGLEAGLMTDRLKKAGVSVVVSLKFPKEPKRPKKPETPKKDDDEDKYEEIPKAKKVYDEEKREWEQRVRGAIALNDAGIPFCFATANLKDTADALKNIGTLVSKGLPRDAALRGLTSAPATLFGTSALLGTIAAGRPANLTVLTAPLGDKETKVRYVFADGFKFTYKSEGKSEPPEIDLTGRWTITSEKTDLGPLEMTLTLKQKDRDVTGTAKSALFGDGTVTAGSVSGKSFKLTLVAKIEGDDAEIELRGELKEGAMKGGATGALGDEVKWTGKKVE